MVKGCCFFLLDAGVKHALQKIEDLFIPHMRPAELCKLAPARSQKADAQRSIKRGQNPQ